MNKYRWLVALIVLVLASLACQTVMGGGSEVPQVPQNTQIPQAPDNNNEALDPSPTEALPPTNENEGDGGGIQDVGGFPVPTDATSVVTAGGVVTYITTMSVNEVVTFYRDEYGKQGLTERTSMSVTMDQLFNLVLTATRAARPSRSAAPIWVTAQPRSPLPNRISNSRANPARKQSSPPLDGELFF
jgi:hypothetical protein